MAQSISISGFYEFLNYSEIIFDFSYFNQIEEINNISHLVENHADFEDINKSLDNLKEEIGNLLKTNFDLWREQSASSIEKGELTYVLCTYP